MSMFFVDRFFAALFGVLGVFAPGFWYLYYQRISSKLVGEHVPQATRRYVRSRFILLSLESSLQCVGWTVYWYVQSLFAASGRVSRVWFIAGLASPIVVILAVFALIWTLGQLRRALRSVGQSET